MIDIGGNIKEARKRAGLSQQELGEKLGGSQSQVWKWETQDTGIRAETLVKIAGALGVSAASLLEPSTVSMIDGREIDYNFACKILEKPIITQALMEMHPSVRQEFISRCCEIYRQKYGVDFDPANSR